MGRSSQPARARAFAVPVSDSVFRPTVNSSEPPDASWITVIGGVAGDHPHGRALHDPADGRVVAEVIPHSGTQDLGDGVGAGVGKEPEPVVLRVLVPPVAADGALGAVLVEHDGLRVAGDVPRQDSRDRAPVGVDAVAGIPSHHDADGLAGEVGFRVERRVGRRRRGGSRRGGGRRHGRRVGVGPAGD